MACCSRGRHWLQRRLVIAASGTRKPVFPGGGKDSFVLNGLRDILPSLPSLIYEEIFTLILKSRPHGVFTPSTTWQLISDIGLIIRVASPWLIAEQGRGIDFLVESRSVVARAAQSKFGRGLLGYLE